VAYPDDLIVVDDSEGVVLHGSEKETKLRYLWHYIVCGPTVETWASLKNEDHDMGINSFGKYCCEGLE
jgi:hypothetical protein